MTMLAFACPDCGVALDAFEPDVRVCRVCGSEYRRRDGVWRFLTAARAEALGPFLAQYRAVRDRDGHRRAAPPEFYRRLPAVGPDDPQAAEWLIRRETYHHLLRHVLAAGPQPVRILDLGAGTGWLSHRVSALGHEAVALDVLDDDLDGLGAVRHYIGGPQAPGEREGRRGEGFISVQADFDALPFAPRQFDLVVFNGSLHYAPDPAATLARAHQMLAPGGSLVVMDSPLFGTDRDGTAMVEDKARQFTSEYGIRGVVRAGAGYLTFARLRASAAALALREQFVPSRGSWLWRLKRHAGRMRLGREPATFGLWVAR